jgi:hydrogenase nickel incorporation protein HypA/HybF
MHELALLTEVVGAVAMACASVDNSEVRAVVLRVGSLCGAQPEALEWAWLLASANSIAQGARLVVEVVPAAVWCSQCQAEHEIDEYFALRCPACDRPTANLVRGREFEVAYVELEVPDHA